MNHDPIVAKTQPVAKSDGKPVVPETFTRTINEIENFLIEALTTADRPQRGGIVASLAAQTMRL